MKNLVTAFAVSLTTGALAGSAAGGCENLGFGYCYTTADKAIGGPFCSISSEVAQSRVSTVTLNITSPGAISTTSSSAAITGAIVGSITCSETCPATAMGGCGEAYTTAGGAGACGGATAAQDPTLAWGLASVQTVPWAADYPEIVIETAVGEEEPNQPDCTVSVSGIAAGTAGYTFTSSSTFSVAANSTLPENAISGSEPGYRRSGQLLKLDTSAPTAIFVGTNDGLSNGFGSP